VSGAGVGVSVLVSNKVMVGKDGGVIEEMAGIRVGNIPIVAVGSGVVSPQLATRMVMKSTNSLGNARHDEFIV
jgi:hypothetical protein